MIYKYVPCQILGHDFDEKSDFLNYEFSKTIARHYSIEKLPSSKENWVEGGCDVIPSRHLNKGGYLSMQKRSAMVMFYPSTCFFFFYARLGKDCAVKLLRCLIG